VKLEQKQFIRNFNAIREMYGIDIVEEERRREPGKNTTTTRRYYGLYSEK